MSLPWCGIIPPWSQYSGPGDFFVKLPTGGLGLVEGARKEDSEVSLGQIRGEVCPVCGFRPGESRFSAISENVRCVGCGEL